MIAFEVTDMTCGHCVSMITKAVKGVDSGAEVMIDLAAKRVDISSRSADAEDFSSAILEAGYTPVGTTVASAAPAISAGAGKTGGCCGGCR